MKTIILKGKGKQQLTSLKTIYENQFGPDQHSNIKISQTLWSILINPYEDYAYTIDHLFALIEYGIIDATHFRTFLDFLKSNPNVHKTFEDILFTENLNYSDEVPLNRNSKSGTSEEIEKRVNIIRGNAILKLKKLFFYDDVFVKQVFTQAPNFVSSLTGPNLKIWMGINFEVAIRLIDSRDYSRRIAKIIKVEDISFLFNAHINSENSFVKFLALFQFFIKNNTTEIISFMASIVRQSQGQCLSEENEKILSLFYYETAVPELADILKEHLDLFLLMTMDGKRIVDLIKLAKKPLDLLSHAVNKNNEIAELVSLHLIPIISYLSRSEFNVDDLHLIAIISYLGKSEFNVDDESLSNFIRKHYYLNNGQKIYFSTVIADQTRTLLNLLCDNEKDASETDVRDFVFLFEKNYIRDLLKLSPEVLNKMLQSPYKSFFDFIIVHDTKLWDEFMVLHSNNRKQHKQDLATLIGSYPNFIKAKLRLELTFNGLIQKSHNNEVDFASAYLLVNSKKHWDKLKGKLATKNLNSGFQNFLFNLKNMQEKDKKSQKISFRNYIVNFIENTFSEEQEHKKEKDAKHGLQFDEDLIKFLCTILTGRVLVELLRFKNIAFSNSLGTQKELYLKEAEYRLGFSDQDHCRLILEVIAKDKYFTNKIVGVLESNDIAIFARHIDILKEITTLTSEKLYDLIRKTEVEFDSSIMIETFIAQPEIFLELFKNSPKKLYKLGRTPRFINLLLNPSIYKHLEAKHCLLLLGADNIKATSINSSLETIFTNRPDLLKDVLELIEVPVEASSDSENLLTILEQTKWIEKLSLEQLIKLKGLSGPSVAKRVKENLIAIASFGKEAKYRAYVHEFFANNADNNVINLIENIPEQGLKEICEKTQLIENYLQTEQAQNISNHNLIKLLKNVPVNTKESIFNLIRKFSKLFVDLLSDPRLTSDLDSISLELKVLSESEECKKLILVDTSLLNLDDFVRLLGLRQPDFPTVIVQAISNYVKQKEAHYKYLGDLISHKACNDLVINRLENTIVELLDNERFVAEILSSLEDRTIAKLVSDQQPVLQASIQIAANNHPIFAKRLLNLAYLPYSNKEVNLFATKNPKVFYALLEFVKNKEANKERSHDFLFEELQFLMNLGDKIIQAGVFSNPCFAEMWKARTQFEEKDIPVILDLLISNQALWYLTDKNYTALQNLLKEYVKSCFYRSDEEIGVLLKVFSNKNCYELFSLIESKDLNTLIKLGGDEVVDGIFSPEFRASESRSKLFTTFVSKCASTNNKKVLEKCFEESLSKSIFPYLTNRELMDLFTSHPMTSSPELVAKTFSKDADIKFQDFIAKADNFTLFKQNKYLAKEIISRPELFVVSKLFQNEGLVEMLLDKEFSETMSFLLENNPSPLFVTVLKNSYDLMPTEIQKLLSPRLHSFVDKPQSRVNNHQDNNNVGFYVKPVTKPKPSTPLEKEFINKIKSAQSAEHFNKLAALDNYVAAAGLKKYNEAQVIQCDKDKLFYYHGLSGQAALSLKILHLAFDLKTDNRCELLITFLKEYQGTIRVNALPIQMLYLNEVFFVCQEQASLNPDVIFQYLSLINLEPESLIAEIEKSKLEVSAASIVPKIELLLSLLLNSYASKPEDNKNKFLIILNAYIKFYSDSFLPLLNRELTLSSYIITLLKENLVDTYFSEVEKSMLKIFLLKSKLQGLQNNVMTDPSEIKYLADDIILTDKIIIDAVLAKKIKFRKTELIKLGDSNLINYFLRNKLFVDDLSQDDLMMLIKMTNKPNFCCFIYPHLYTKLNDSMLNQLILINGFKNREEMVSTLTNTHLCGGFVKHINSVNKSVEPIHVNNVNHHDTIERVSLNKSSEAVGENEVKAILNGEDSTTKVMLKKLDVDRKGLLDQITKGKELRKVNKEQSLQPIPNKENLLDSIAEAMKERRQFIEGMETNQHEVVNENEDEDETLQNAAWS